MYQLLFMTNDDTSKKIAANVPEKDASFLTERLNNLGGFTRYNVSLYDTKVTTKKYEDYGRFKSKQELLLWLFLNVFTDRKECKTMEDFTEQYRQMLERCENKKRLDNMATDILYDEYITGKDTFDIWKKLRWHVMDIMENYNCKRPTKDRLRSFIRLAFVKYVLE